MRKYIVSIVLLLNLSCLIAQGYRVGHATWTDSLREYLAIDSVYCRDSVVQFEAYDTTFQLHITKKRPDFKRSIALIDSISSHLDNDTTFARLVTILNEFDVKYLSEFLYTVDYFQNTYQRRAITEHNKINELGIIQRIEQYLYFNYLLRQDSFDLVDYLIDEKQQNSSNVKYFSITWERRGSYDISMFMNYYLDNKELYYEKLRTFLINGITEKNVYRVINRFKLFYHYDRSRIDCNYLRELLNNQTSSILIEALNGLNQKFHNGDSCLQAIIDEYYKN